MNIIQNKTYPTMFHAVYPDGTPSADFYNIDRAKDHSYVLEDAERESKIPIARRGLGSPVGAFK